MAQVMVVVVTMAVRWWGWWGRCVSVGANMHAA